MQQTRLSFGQTLIAPNTPKKHLVCACDHKNLSSIRDCKKCYRIIVLKRLCANTIRTTTGEPLGTWGTKEQLLDRLMKNSKSGKNTVWDDVFCCTTLFLHFIILLHIVCVACVHYFQSFLHASEKIARPAEVASETIARPAEVKANTADKANDVASPIVTITTSSCKNGWVSSGRLKFHRKHGNKTKHFNIRYPHHRKVRV